MGKANTLLLLLILVFVSSLGSTKLLAGALFSARLAEKHKQVACAPRNSITPVTYAPLAGKGAAPRDEMPVTPDSLPFSCSSCDADRIPPSFIYGTVCFAHAGQLLYNRDFSARALRPSSNFALAASILLGTLNLVAPSARGQNAEPGPSSSEPPLPVSDISRPSREVPVETNANPINENFRRFRYNVGVTVREVYDDNINISSFQRTSDSYTVIEPGIHLGFGDSAGGFNFLSFDYVASVYFFAEQTQRNTVEHLVHLAAQHDFGRLVLGLSEEVRILDGTSLNTLSNTTGVQANTDVGGPSRVNIYTTTLNGTYDLTGKLFLSGQASYAISDYETLISSQVASANLYINYVYSPKLVIGLGATAGVNSSDGPAADETFEQMNVRANYIVSGKISLNISGGLEFRQFGGGGNSVSPVYEIAGSYRPFENTAITIAGSRRTVSSASLAGQDYSQTSISLTFSQRLFSRATFSLGVGYTNSDYLSATNGASTARSDDYFYIEPSIDLDITRYWTIGFYYLFRQDSSTLAFFSFYDNQFGVRSSLTF